MPEYRIYSLTSGNKIAGPAIEVDCQSDEEAIAQARTLLIGQDIEIWSDARIVTRLRSADETASGRFGSIPRRLRRHTAPATWEITIKCRDGSRLRFSEHKASVPENGEIVQTADVGQIVRARIDACHEEPPKGGHPGVCFQVMATEI